MVFVKRDIGLRRLTLELGRITTLPARTGGNPATRNGAASALPWPFPQCRSDIAPSHAQTLWLQRPSLSWSSFESYRIRQLTAWCALLFVHKERQLALYGCLKALKGNDQSPNGQAVFIVSGVHECFVRPNV